MLERDGLVSTVHSFSVTETIWVQNHHRIRAEPWLHIPPSLKELARSTLIERSRTQDDLAEIRRDLRGIPVYTIDSQSTEVRAHSTNAMCTFSLQTVELAQKKDRHLLPLKISSCTFVSLPLPPIGRG